MHRVSYEEPDLKTLVADRFVVDMHYHSAASHDCRTPLKEIVALARKRGLGVALTDHNTPAGVVAAAKLRNAPVYPGIEICSKEGKEVIAYFYTWEALVSFCKRRLDLFHNAKNPLRGSRTRYPLRELLWDLGDEECVVSIPHPFAPQPRRSYPYFQKHPELLAHVDVIEAFNRAVTRRANLSALGWAAELRKPVVGGSDGHLLPWLGRGVTATKAETWAEHLDLIKKGLAEVYGSEMGRGERVRWPYKTMTVKLRNGARDGLRTGLRVSKRALKGEEVRRP